MKSKKAPQKPIEGEWFRVNPKLINQKLFEEKRENPKEEWLRKEILGAFKKVNSGFYITKPFETMFPKKTWSEITTDNLKDMAKELGEGMTTMHQQLLEWAQRLDNGETWEALATEIDTTDWYRAILVDGKPFTVGNSCASGEHYKATAIDTAPILRNFCKNVVPSVMRYVNE